MKKSDYREYLNDQRIVLTLDAGGTKLAFSGFCGKENCIEPFILPAVPGDLDNFMDTITAGFRKVRDSLEKEKKTASAISFGFPGPAHYKEGIITDPPNLPAFKGGVALKSFLEDKFNLPVFINNDGNLFALGEWAAGFLPWVNAQLKAAGKKKQYRNLVGITLGTGFGCGIVVNGELITGDNDSGAEIWLARNRLMPDFTSESSVGRDGLKLSYSKKAGCSFEEAPEPREIAAIASGRVKGNMEAAAGAYRDMGIVAGDAIAHALTLVDGLVVIGGGLVNDRGLFFPALMETLNGTIKHTIGHEVPRLVMKAYDLEDRDSLSGFIRGNEKSIKIYGSDALLPYDALFRTGVGISRLGTGKAIFLGAYVFALMQLDS